MYLFYVRVKFFSGVSRIIKYNIKTCVISEEPNNRINLVNNIIYIDKIEKRAELVNS